MTRRSRAAAASNHLGNSAMKIRTTPLPDQRAAPDGAGARHRGRPAAHPIPLLTALLLLLSGGCSNQSDSGAGNAPANMMETCATDQKTAAEALGARSGSDPERSDEVAASHILVAWTGARDCPAGLQRTMEQAEQRAQRIAFLLRTGRGDMDVLARRYSDDPSAKRNGGYLGVFRRNEMMDALEELVSTLAVGETGGPVPTAYGWHIVRREPVLKAHLHHVLVAHRDALGAGSSVRRDQAEAARIAHALRIRLSQPDADPCLLAATFSDDPVNHHVCGDLGLIEPGLLEPEIERALFALQPGEVSQVVETDYGFHVFWRAARDKAD